jgi:tripartite-type tricarboxylate transporter receptor subunit TctC
MTLPMLERRSLLAALGLAVLPGAAAAAWPERPIKWIVAYAPGGGTDTLARLIGASLATRLGQPVVIDNRPGAATNIGAEAAAKSPGDGYTVFTADNGTLIFNPALFRRLPYDPDRDFRNLGLFARFHLVLAVKANSAFATAKDLLDRARAAPGSIDYASPGVGSPHHLAMERLLRETGARMSHVPYRGAAPAINDMLAGTLESMVVDFASGGEHLRSGRMRPLAVLSAARIDGLPAVPTVQEALGVRDFEAYAWQGLVAPRATPDAIAERLTTELLAVMAEPAIRSRMQEIGLEPLSGNPAEMQRLTESQRAIWVPLIRDLGITLD